MLFFLCMYYIVYENNIWKRMSFCKYFQCAAFRNFVRESSSYHWREPKRRASLVSSFSFVSLISLDKLRAGNNFYSIVLYIVYDKLWERYYSRGRVALTWVLSLPQTILKWKLFRVAQLIFTLRPRPDDTATRLTRSFAPPL
jgi:hypothetical protein